MGNPLPQAQSPKPQAPVFEMMPEWVAKNGIFILVDLQGELAESHTALELIEKERRRRAQERDKLKLFLKRVLTI